MSRCDPSLVQLLAELVISRSFVSYKSGEGHHRKSLWKNYTNVDINDISKVLLMVIDLMPLQIIVSDILSIYIFFFYFSKSNTIYVGKHKD